MSKLKENLEKLNGVLEKMNIEDIQYVLGSKKAIFTKNLLAGLSRGIGIGIGVTIVTAILIYILRKIVILNIPVIGDYIADLIEIMQSTRGIR